MLRLRSDPPQDCLNASMDLLGENEKPRSQGEGAGLGSRCALNLGRGFQRTTGEEPGMVSGVDASA
jgi:hypothetical protein